MGMETSSKGGGGVEDFVGVWETADTNTFAAEEVTQLITEYTPGYMYLRPIIPLPPALQVPFLPPLNLSFNSSVSSNNTSNLNSTGDGNGVPAGNAAAYYNYTSILLSPNSTTGG
uniref:Neurofibromin n=1 Tax=Lygus hesperus TaxID=30085 RepID=A0A0A9XT87_LYGHE